MEYTEEVLNRTTGDLETKSLGNWITITELGKKYGTGPRQTRTVLKQMGILEARYTGSGRIHRHSLTGQAVLGGLGKHLTPNKKGQTPFDVLSPKGQQWIADRWADTVFQTENIKADNPKLTEAGNRLEAFKESRKTPFVPQMEVCWLIDHYPDMSQADIGVVLTLPKQTVSHWVNLREKQRSFLRASQTRSKV